MSTAPMTTRKPTIFALETIRAIVRGEEHGVRNTFVRRHKKQVEAATRLAHTAHVLLQERHPSWGVTDRRRMAVALMVHTALHNVITSIALLVSGYPVPSGNAMRQYVEALSMALLFSDESLPDFGKFEANRRHFDAAGAVDRLSKKKVGTSVQRTLQITSDGWKTLVETRNFYHGHSHNTVVALGYTMDWRKSKGAVLGAHYDPKKHRLYQAELTGRATALKAVASLVHVLDRTWTSAHAV